MPDEAVSKNDIDYSDIPATTEEFWKDARVIVKVCKKHGELTEEEAYFHKSGYNRCKSCDAENSRLWREKNKDLLAEYKRKYREENKDRIKEYEQRYRKRTRAVRRKNKKKIQQRNRQYKVCKVHGKLTKKQIYFRKDGCKQCRSCRVDKHRQWFEKNKERCNVRSRQWREKNKERYRETKRQWREKNKERIKEMHRQWYEKNKYHCREWYSQYFERNYKLIRERVKKWYEKNKERTREQRRKYYEKNKDKYILYSSKRQKELVKNIHDVYIKQLISKELNIKRSNIIPGMIESKRLSIIVDRLYKQRIKGEKHATKINSK